MLRERSLRIRSVTGQLIKVVPSLTLFPKLSLLNLRTFRFDMRNPRLFFRARFYNKVLTALQSAYVLYASEYAILMNVWISCAHWKFSNTFASLLSRLLVTCDLNMPNTEKAQVNQINLSKDHRERTKIKSPTTHSNKYQNYRGEHIQQSIHTHTAIFTTKRSERQLPERAADGRANGASTGTSVTDPYGRKR